MPDCMREIDARGLRDAVLESAHSKPFLGICIGLQMLFERAKKAMWLDWDCWPVAFDVSQRR